MLRDLTTWLLYSPLRLAGVVALTVTVAVAVIIGIWLVPSDTATTVAPPAPSTGTWKADDEAPSRAGRSPSARRGDESRDSNAAPIRRAADRFLDTYLHTGHPVDAHEWRRRIRPLVTPALWRGLRYTDPNTTPRGPYRLRPQVRGSFGAVIDADLATGPALRLSLVVFNDRWRIADVEPLP